MAVVVGCKSKFNRRLKSMGFWSSWSDEERKKREKRGKKLSNAYNNSDKEQQQKLKNEIYEEQGKKTDWW